MTFLGPRIVDKLVLALIIMTLYWRVGENHKLSNYNNLAAVLFLWTILPGYAAAAFIPTIVLERPLFVRYCPLCFPTLSIEAQSLSPALCSLQLCLLLLLLFQQASLCHL